MHRALRSSRMDGTRGTRDRPGTRPVRSRYCYCALHPPSMAIAAPVKKAASGEARYPAGPGTRLRRRTARPSSPRRRRGSHRRHGCAGGRHAGPVTEHSGCAEPRSGGCQRCRTRDERCARRHRARPARPVPGVRCSPDPGPRACRSRTGACDHAARVQRRDALRPDR